MAEEEYTPSAGDDLGAPRKEAIQAAFAKRKSRLGDKSRQAELQRRVTAYSTFTDPRIEGPQLTDEQRKTAREQYEKLQREGSPDFSDMADMKVEAEPFRMEGDAPSKVKVTGVDRDKAMAQSAPTAGTQYSMEGGKVRFSPKGDLYVYEYDPKMREYTIVDGPSGIGAKFGADHPSIAKFDESRKVAQQESGVAPPEELMIEGDASVDPDSLSPAEFRERYGFSREEAEPSLDESVFAPPGARSKMAPVGPVSTAEAEDPEMRTMRAQEARRTDPQSPALQSVLFEGPQPIIDKDGVLYNNNVVAAIAQGRLDIDEWPKIKQRLLAEGTIKTQIGGDRTEDPAFRSRLMASQAAAKAYEVDARRRGYRG